MRNGLAKPTCWPRELILVRTGHEWTNKGINVLKSHLPYAGIIRSSPYSPR